MPTSDSNLVTSCMTLLEILMKDIHENDHKYVKTWLAVSYARIFICSFLYIFYACNN